MKKRRLPFVMLTSLEFRILYIDITHIQQTRHPSIQIAHENLGLAEVRISLVEKYHREKNKMYSSTPRKLKCDIWHGNVSYSRATHLIVAKKIS